MKTTKGSRLKSTKSSPRKGTGTVRKTKPLAVEIPDLGWSPSDLATLKKAFRNASVSSVDRVAGVLKPKQKNQAVTLMCSKAKKKEE